MHITIGADSKLCVSSEIRCRLFPSLIVVLSLSATTSADMVFSTHSIVGAYGLSGGIEYLPGEFHPGFNSIIQAENSADTGLLWDSADYGFHGGETAVAQAIADIDANRFLRTYAYARNTGSGLFGPVSRVTAAAAWRDVVYTHGANPAVLRLNFSLDGSLFGSPTAEVGQYTLDAAFSLHRYSGLDSINRFEFQSNNIGYPNYPNLQYVDLQARLAMRFSETFSAVGGWDSTSFVNGAFNGDFHIDVDYDPTIGGYAWGLGLSSQVLAINGEAFSNALNTLTLNSVTLPDGTPIDVTFESGLSFQVASTVPEPSSIVLFGLGAVGLCYVAAYRRTKSQVGA